MSKRQTNGEVYASEEELIARYSSMVRRIATHLSLRLPDCIETDDLVQSGLIALMDAARHYVSDKGASFETYAGIRIRGAMLDEVRRSDWIPRSVYRQQRELTAIIREIENRTGGSASPVEIAKELGISLEQYHKRVDRLTRSRVLSLDQIMCSDHSGAELWDSEGAAPEKEAERDQFREALKDSIASLPKREALVMSLYYDQEFNLKEIGWVIGVSESRVCQIHGQALVRLRARLEEWRDSRVAHDSATVSVISEEFQYLSAEIGRQEGISG